MSVLRIRLERERAWSLPGSDLSGAVRWDLDRQVEALELRLFWYTRGRGSEDVEVVERLRFLEPEPSGERAFSFRLPDGPYSFSGALIALAWALELVTDPGDEVERFDLLVGPRPVEVRLTPLPDP